MPKLTVHYFDLPGRAEPTRIMLDLAGIEYTDKLYGQKEGQANWMEFKPKTPYGQLPVLEVDNEVLAQSASIEEYVAGLTGMYPKGSDLEVAQAKSLLHFITDMYNLFAPTWAIKDLDEKIKARQELVAGPLKAKLEQLGSMLEANGGWATKQKSLTYIDISLFCTLSMFVSGFIDGVPKTMLDDHPALKAFHNKVAEVPGIMKRYEGAADGIRAAFKPLP